MPTWKVTVEYDGSRYSGWQEQKNAPKTVMGALREAVEAHLGTPAEMQGAGRTDAGVHALGQVLHVKANPKRSIAPAAFRDALNDALGHDIAVLSVEPAPERFHARHHAESRRYLYRVSHRKNAFAKRHVWWVKESLQAEAMQAAVAMLPGRHDFSAFRADDPARPDESPIVVVESATIERQGEEWLFRIEASHFLWRMVRRIAGGLVRVGTGEFPLEDFGAALDGDIRYQEAISRWTAPAAGLYLEEVRYPADLSKAIKPPRNERGEGKKPAGKPLGRGTASAQGTAPAARGGEPKRSPHGAAAPARKDWRGGRTPTKNGRGKPRP